MADEILVSTDDHVCTITLNRPDKRNALTVAMVEAFRSTVAKVGTSGDVRVLVVRGNGAGFCAGMDLRELQAQREAGAVDLMALEHALEALEGSPLPSIAAVHGDAVAGGCELALHCDVRIAADTARFAMPLARIGIAVPVTLTWKLVDTIGAAATKEMLFTGEAIGAEQALALGMVNRVVAAADLDRAVTDMARIIAHNAPLSVRAMKAYVQRLAEERRAVRRDDLEALAERVRSSEDAREGLAAQRERRPPRFRGH
jgi:enoyl-CoA hydratase/carnithine racemase